MIAAYLATCLTGLVSAFLPVTPIEPYLIALVATTGHEPLALGIAAGVGQTAGKTVFFLGARGALHSARLRRWVDAAKQRGERKRARRAENAEEATNPRPASRLVKRLKRVGRPIGAAAKKLTALLAKPALTVPILFLSAVTGMPPLLATSIYTAYTKINTPMFVLTCLVGRTIRFTAIAYAPHLIMG